MTTTLNKGLLAPSDIADLAGVSRAAVSNWRKRVADFPEPSGGTASRPLFAASDVREWLQRHPDKDKAAKSETRTSREWDSALWAIANDLRGEMSGEDMSMLIAEAAVASAKGLPIATNDDMPSTVRKYLPAAIKSIPVTELPRVVDGLLERTARAQGKSVGLLGFVGSRTSTLLASLAAPMKGGTLYDPTCGIGAALLEAIAMGARPDRIVGEDIMETAIRLTDARASLRGIEIETSVNDIVLADPDPTLKADVILAEPPFSLPMTDNAALLDSRLQFGIPPRRNLDGFWPQHVVSHLAEGGVGYVITTPGFLFRSGPEAEIRANLLRSGWVRAIVSLPGRMVPHTSIPLVLLVLEKTEGKEVLLIDGSSCESPETSVSHWLLDESALNDVPHQYVPILDLLEGDSILSPPRWIEQTPVSPANIQNTYFAARSELKQSAAQLDTTASQLWEPHVHTQPQVLTVGELIEAGALEMVPPQPSRAYEGTELEQRLIDAATIRRQELPVVAELEPLEDQELTMPGDVLVTTMNGVQTLVDAEGGLIPTGGVYRLRVLDPAAIDPNYLADVLRGDWNLRFAQSTALRSIPIRDIEVPIIPIAEQESTRTIFAQARELRELAKQVSEASDSLTETTLTALRHGINLTPSAERHTK